MNHPLVSVIVPNYNHAPFLDERINSILGQTYDNYELIILDDKSTDNSIDIINRYKNCLSVSCIEVNEENSGSPFKQWWKGFEHAKGELIWIAESDDSCEKEFLSTLVEEFENDKECVLAFCRSIRVDIQGGRLGEDGFPNDFNIDGQFFVKNKLSRYNYIVNASSAVFSKEVLLDIDSTYTSFRGCGDWVFWIEVASRGHVSFVNQPLNYFRQHGTNTTTEQTRTGKGELEVVKVSDYLKQKGFIDWKDYLRIKIVHIYSVKYGKLSKILSNDVKKEIVSSWSPLIISCLLVDFLYLLTKVGIKIVNR